MRVVVVNDFANVNGGASQVAIQGAIALHQRGLEVTFFAAVGPASQELGDAGVDVRIVGRFDILRDPNRLRAFRHGLWNSKAAQDLGDLLRTLDAAKTVVHVHSWTKALSSSVVREALDRRFPVLLTLHDYFSACPNGGFFNFKLNTICKLKPLSFECLSTDCDARTYAHKLWRVSRQLVQEQIGTLPDGIRFFIAPSRFSEEILRPFLPAERRMFNVVNPIPVCKQAPVQVAAQGTPVFVGRLSSEKGVLPLARVLARMGIPGVFVGDGPLRPQIEALAPQSKITGWLPHPGVITELCQARFLVFPSLWYETQGLVLSEAAAVGVPSLVSDICAGRERVEDGVTGLWFRAGDETDMQEKISLLLSDDDLVRRMGHAAYEKFWADPPTSEFHALALEKCYREMLASSAR